MSSVGLHLEDIRRPGRRVNHFVCCYSCRIPRRPAWACHEDVDGYRINTVRLAVSSDVLFVVRGVKNNGKEIPHSCVTEGGVWWSTVLKDPAPLTQMVRLRNPATVAAHYCRLHETEVGPCYKQAVKNYCKPLWQKAWIRHKCPCMITLKKNSHSGDAWRTKGDSLKQTPASDTV